MMGHTPSTARPLSTGDTLRSGSSTRESLAADHRIVTAPEHRFEGLARFDGLHAFDGSREIAVHDPRLHIRMPGATAIAAAQAASQTVALGLLTPYRFDGLHAFDGSTSFDGGYSALRVEHEEAPRCRSPDRHRP